MSDNRYNYKKCIECKGEGLIFAKFSKTVHSCIHCNGSGSTSHGPRSEADQVLLFKIAWDYLHGKEKGWYH
jgi:DnaJ-class molecular chaperone